LEVQIEIPDSIFSRMSWAIQSPGWMWKDSGLLFYSMTISSFW
jgi:hypothetical protein